MNVKVREMLKLKKGKDLMEIKFIYLSVLLTLVSCNIFFGSKDSANYGQAGNSQSATLATSNFDFNTAGDYTYDTNYISVTAGRATLLTVDQTFSTASDFSAGTHLATQYTGGVLTIASAGGCDGTSTNCATLSADWTPKYASSSL